jgi:hypothetical protein
VFCIDSDRGRKWATADSRNNEQPLVIVNLLNMAQKNARNMEDSLGREEVLQVERNKFSFLRHRREGVRSKVVT